MERERKAETPRKRGAFPPVGALFAFLAAVFSAPDSAVAWSGEDSALGNYLIRELRYYDTARRWLDSLESRRGRSEEDRSEIASFRIDILLGEGKQTEAEAALEKFKRDFPNHRRASLGGIGVISGNMGKVILLYDRAAVQPDPKKAEELRAEAMRIFTEEVEKPLEALIQDANAKVKDLKEKQKPDPNARGPTRPSEELDQAIQGRDQAELSQIKMYLVLARKLPDASPDRKAALEKGQALADRYVRERYDFPVMQYEGQLQRGIIAFELGNYDVAQDHLSLLYDIVPPWPGPYAEMVVGAFRSLRIQAVLFGARALVAAGQHGRAAAILREYYLGSKSGPFALSGAEDDPSLRQFAVLAQLEYGVALACGGNSVEGLEEIQKVIARYSAGPAGTSNEYATEARRALGRVAGCAGVRLRGQDLYEAGLGQKSELRWEEALESFRRALMELWPERPEDREVMARCLNEIGEINFILKRYDESVLAYEEFYQYFQDAEDALARKVAQNFLAAATQATESRKDEGGSSALDAILDVATKFNDAKGSGIGGEELKMKQAQDLEAEGKFAEARDVYLSIPKEANGIKVPFYWRAVASSWICVYRLWDKADEEGRKALEAELETAVKELEAIPSQALADGEESGAAVAALGLGEVHFQFERYAEAAAALEIFNGELAEDVAYRCLGLGYLVLAKARLGDCAGGRKDFTELYKLAPPGTPCKEEPVAAYAAQALSDCYAAAGDAKDAALFILIWSKHPSPAVAEELKRPEILYQVANRLYQGGRTKEGDELLAKLEEIIRGKPDLNADLGRQVVVLKGSRYQQEKQWDKLIETYEGYIQQYEGRGVYYDDPYVWQALAEAYIAHNMPRPTFQDYENANRGYGAALGIMNQRLPKDPKLECTFWRWALRYCQLKLRIGEAGQPSAFGDVILLVDQHKHKEMCGLRDQFLKLSEEATRKQAASKLR